MSKNIKLRSTTAKQARPNSGRPKKILKKSINLHAQQPNKCSDCECHLPHYLINLQNQKNELESFFSDLQIKCSEHEVTITSLQQVNANQSTTIKELTQQAKHSQQIQSTFDQKDRQISNLVQANLKLQQQVKEKNNLTKVITKSVVESKQEISSLSTDVADLQAQLANVTRQLQVSSSELNTQLEAEIQAAQKVREYQKEQAAKVGKLNARVDKAKEKLSNYTQQK